MINMTLKIFLLILLVASPSFAQEWQEARMNVAIMGGESCLTKFQSEEGTSSLSGIAINPYSTRNSMASRFLATKTTSICKIDVELLKVETPTDDIIVYIYSDTTGPHPNISLGNTISRNESELTTSYAWYTFTFSSPVSITINNYYWVAIKINYSSPDSDNSSWNTTTTGVTLVIDRGLNLSGWTNEYTTRTNRYKLYE